MKFSTIIRGTRAERETSVRVSPGQNVPALLRPLTSDEEADAMGAAMTYARTKGVTDPGGGNPIFDAALWAFIVAAAMLDPDSPKDARTPFFDQGGLQVLQGLDTDTLAILYEEQRVWQEECSPSVKAHSAAELFAMTKVIAEEGGDRFFVQLSPRTRVIWARTTAALLVSSPELSALFGSAYAPTTATS